MRLAFLLPILLFSLSIQAQDVASTDIDVTVEQEETINLDWMTSLEKAKKAAKKTKKPILVYFSGSDWCTPCKKLEKFFFYTEEFQEVAKNYHLVYLDNPYRDDIIPEKDKKQNKKIADKFKVKFPTVLALDYRGSERNRVERFSGEDPRYHWMFMKKNKSIFRL